MKSVFKTKVGEKEVELAVQSPSSDQKKEAQIVYAQSVTKAMSRKLISRDKLESYLKEQGIWDDAMEKKDKELQQKIRDNVTKLSKGGFKVSEGTKLALKIKEMRQELVELRSKITNWDNITAEAMGDNARFNYLVSVCTVYNDTGEPYFKGLDDYESQSNSDIAFESASALASLIAGFDPKFEESLPENKFLKRFNYKEPTPEVVITEEDGDVDTAVFYDDEGKPVLPEVVKAELIAQG